MPCRTRPADYPARVQPADLAHLRIPGRPAIAADSSIVVAVATPDLQADLYRSTLVRLRPVAGVADTGEPVQLTRVRATPTR